MSPALYHAGVLVYVAVSLLPGSVGLVSAIHWKRGTADFAMKVIAVLWLPLPLVIGVMAYLGWDACYRYIGGQ